jgi:hypothetical protein
MALPEWESEHSIVNVLLQIISNLLDDGLYILYSGS